MSRNAPTSANKASQRRIPIIIQGLRDGLSYGEIGEQCIPPVDRKTIYRDRQTIEFQSFFNDLVDEYLAELAELKRMGGKDRKMAIMAKWQLIKTMMPRRIQAQIDFQQPIVIEMFQREMPDEQDKA